jgi:nitrogen fixation/metabolism regulation signal transduction histidine kinase
MPMDTQELPPIERAAKGLIVGFTAMLAVAVLLTLFLAVVVFLLLVTGVATPWPPLPPSY